MILGGAQGRVVVSALVVASCAGTAAPGAAPATAPLVVEIAPAATGSAGVVIAGVGSVAPAASAAPAAGPQSVRRTVDVVLKPGDPPCTLVFDVRGADDFKEDEDTFTAWFVSRIATEASGACAAGVLYDLPNEPIVRADNPPAPLEGGDFLKPGRTAPPDRLGLEYSVLLDLNFDGYADACVARTQNVGHSNYFQYCWLFDPQKRIFVRTAALDPLVWVKIDTKKKTLESTRGAGGGVVVTTRYQWIGGELVMVYEEVTRENRPDGGPIPRGFTNWVLRSEFRRGKLVKVFDGPVRRPQPPEVP